MSMVATQVSACAVTADDVLFAVASLGGDISTAEAEAVACALDDDDLARVSSVAGEALDEQMLAAQAELIAVLLERGYVAENPGGIVVRVPQLSRPEFLYAQGDELTNGMSITLYRPAVINPGQPTVDQVELRRDGIRPFHDAGRKIAWRAGIPYVDAMSAPGNQSTYTYMLLEEVGKVDRETLRFSPVGPGARKFFGMTQWDRYAVDQKPGRYFVTARNEAGKTACLLGPFARHIEALVMVDRARNLVPEKFGPDAWWLSYGTVRVDMSQPNDPVRGKLNDDLLSPEQLAGVEALVVRQVPGHPSPQVSVGLS